MRLPSIRWLVVLGTHVRLTPQARAKGQVLEALLEGFLDATSVDLEGAGVELDVLETQLCLRLLLRDDAVVSPEEHRPVRGCELRG